MGRTRRKGPRHEEWKGAEPMDAGAGVYHSMRCFGKLSYPTKAKAVRAKRNHSRNSGIRYDVYRCPFCNKWHLTTHPW